jgi:hypothetical protein
MHFSVSFCMFCGRKKVSVVSFFLLDGEEESQSMTTLGAQRLRRIFHHRTHRTHGNLAAPFFQCAVCDVQGAIAFN